MAGGQPTKMTDKTIQLLEDAFKLGCTDLEACLNANISKSTLYNLQNENPKFLERKNRLKETPFLIARTSVIKGMTDDPNLALKYLERKKKDEFSLRTEHEVTGVKVDDVMSGLDPKSQELLKKMLKEKLEGETND